jgi:hypothetical protein
MKKNFDIGKFFYSAELKQGFLAHDTEVYQYRLQRQFYSPVKLEMDVQ